MVIDWKPYLLWCSSRGSQSGDWRLTGCCLVRLVSRPNTHTCFAAVASQQSGIVPSLGFKWSNQSVSRSATFERGQAQSAQFKRMDRSRSMTLSATLGAVNTWVECLGLSSLQSCSACLVHLGSQSFRIERVLCWQQHESLLFPKEGQVTHVAVCQ